MIVEQLACVTTVKRNLLDEIDKIVESVVCSNMQHAMELKMNNEDNKLTQEECLFLIETTKNQIKECLPKGFFDDGEFCKLIGGAEHMNSIILSFIEKHVFEKKLRMNCYTT